MEYSWTILRFCGWLAFEEAMFLMKTPRRKYFLLRLALALALIFGAVPIIEFLWELVPFWPTGTWSLKFVVLCLLTLGGVAICFKITGKELLFVGTGAYALQHIAICTGVIIRYFAPIENAVVNEILYNYLIYIVVGLIAYFALIRPSDSQKIIIEKDIRQIALAAIIMVASVYLSGISGGSDPFVSRFVCRLYSIICGGLVLFLQFTVASKNKLQKDKEEINRLFHIEKEQCELSKTTIDIINMKCHDIRYLISGIETIDDSEERKKYITDLKKEVTIYDKITKTGNDALDVVLMEKSLLCDKYNIKFSYMADGKRLDFMETLDVYVLFGNALDNAIESVCKEDEAEKRTISLKVSMVNNMLLVHIENHSKNEVQFDESGLPVTTKEDNGYHGYGVKSIKYIADKYRGEMRTTSGGDRFVLDVLFAGPVS